MLLTAARSCSHSAKDFVRHVDPSALLTVQGKVVPNLSFAHRTSDLSSLHFVFLEGPVSTLKSKLLDRLAGMGYAIRYDSFPSLCLDNPHLHPAGELELHFFFFKFFFLQFEVGP
jgi:hypothetical protein